MSEEEEARDEKKKAKGLAGVAPSTELDDLSRRLESEYFDLISHFSRGTTKGIAWYMDSGVLKHMIGPQDVFETLVEWDSKLHMMVGDKSQKEIRESGC